MIKVLEDFFNIEFKVCDKGHLNVSKLILFFALWINIGSAIDYNIFKGKKFNIFESTWNETHIVSSQSVVETSITSRLTHVENFMCMISNYNITIVGFNVFNQLDLILIKSICMFFSFQIF